jgi:uncharacterized phage-associated protein
MATVHDVAAEILRLRAPMSAMKLQKLVYYSQAWSLAWDDRPLFREQIEAWANGPVVPELFRLHRGQFEISEWPAGNPANLTQPERDTIGAVFAFYGDRSPQWLSDLTHMEKPWKLARAGLAPGERGNQLISLESMQEYYSSLPSE